MHNYIIEYQIPYGGRKVFHCCTRSFEEALEQLFIFCPVAKIVDFEEK